MPSPFPGMDPWLEEPRMYADLRFTLVVRLSDALNAVLAEKYYSRINHITEDGESFIEVRTVRGHGNKKLTAIEIPERYPQWRAGRAVGDWSEARILIRLFRDPWSDPAGPPAGPEIVTHRFGDPEYIEVCPTDYQRPLPALSVPLLPGEPEAVVELQPLLDYTYDAGRYPMWVRYDRRWPDPPLATEQQAWAEGILRAKGLIPTTDGGAA